MQTSTRSIKGRKLITRSFLKGAGSVLNLWGSYNGSNYTNKFGSDLKVIRSDWEKVLQGLNDTFTKYTARDRSRNRQLF